MPPYQHFGDAMQAKRFLISRIVEEARRQNEPLSGLEEKMLYFSEQFPTLPDMMDVWQRFEKEVDSEKYEAKISRLGQNAFHRDVVDSPENVSLWKDALKILKKEDHYILVMIGSLGTSAPAPGAATNKEQWRLLGYGLLTVVLIVVILIPLFVYKIEIPAWLGGLVLAAIAAGVYRLSTYVERRGKRQYGRQKRSQS